MPPDNIRCPQCNLLLSLPPAAFERGLARCPRCGHDIPLRRPAGAVRRDDDAPPFERKSGSFQGATMALWAALGVGVVAIIGFLLLILLGLREGGEAEAQRAATPPAPPAKIDPGQFLPQEMEAGVVVGIAQYDPRTLLTPLVHKYGPDTVITVHLTVRGLDKQAEANNPFIVEGVDVTPRLPQDDMGRVVQFMHCQYARAVREAAAGMGPGVRSHWLGGRDVPMLSGVAPVEDLQAFARRIGCGRIDRVDVQGKTVYLTMQLSEVPRPPEEPLELALFDVTRPFRKAHRRDAARRLVGLSSQKNQPLRAEIRAGLLKGLDEAAGDTTKFFERQELIRALAAWSGPADLPYFREVLGSDQRDLRPAAIDFVAQHKDENALDALIDLLPDHPQEARRALLTMGPLAEKPLLQYVRTSVRLREIRDQLRRVAAAEILKEVVTLDSVPDLIKMLPSEGDGRIMRNLAQALARFTDDEQTLDALVQQLGNQVVASEIRAVLEKGDQRVEKALLRYVNHGNMMMRIEVCHVLGSVGTKSSLPALRERLKDPNMPVARSAQAAIGKINVRLGLEAKPEDVRDLPIGFHGEWTLPIAVEELRSPNSLRSLDALRWLADQTPMGLRPEVTRAINEVLSSRDARLRSAAVQALGVWGDADSVALLIKRLAIDDVPVRQQIVLALGKLKDEKGADAVAGQLGQSFMRREASDALVQMGQMAEKAVLRQVNHPDTAVREEACKILEAIGTRASLGVLMAAAAQKRDKKTAWAANEATQAILRRDAEARELAKMQRAEEARAAKLAEAKPAAKPAPAKPEEPPAGEAAQLGEQLPKAPPAQQEEIIQTLRDARGSEYTKVLVEVVPKLAGSARDSARAGLAERLTRMSVKTLKSYLQDDAVELRRAAAAACAKKGARELVPDLIALLSQEEDLPVAVTAHEALKKLTGHDFELAREPGPAERKAAAERWQKWWQANARPPE